MIVPQNFTLYGIYGLEKTWDNGEEFDLKLLPFDIGQGVTIEDVSTLLSPESFNEYITGEMGQRSIKRLKETRYALVHRYERAPIIVDGEKVGEVDYDQNSFDLLRKIAACLRLIRPMRQDTGLMYGKILPNGQFDLIGFEHPYDLLETPQNQKHFKLRTRDAEELKNLLPEFLRAMNGEFWKFRMSVQFHELGHFQHRDKKARFLLWASGIESIYTSHDYDHQGGLVATERIKWFLGESTSIYPKGELLDLTKDPNLTLGSILADLYECRNFHAHGDKLNDHFLKDTLRDGIDNNSRVIVYEVLFEAQSFVIRSSLLRILRDGLLDHFADAGPAQAYFGAQHLTRSELQAKYPKKKKQKGKP
jgi:hypothetical protein